MGTKKLQNVIPSALLATAIAGGCTMLFRSTENSHDYRAGTGYTQEADTLRIVPDVQPALTVHEEEPVSEEGTAETPAADVVKDLYESELKDAFTKCDRAFDYHDFFDKLKSQNRRSKGISEAFASDAAYMLMHIYFDNVARSGGLEASQHEAYNQLFRDFILKYPDRVRLTLIERFENRLCFEADDMVSDVVYSRIWDAEQELHVSPNMHALSEAAAGYRMIRKHEEAKDAVREYFQLAFENEFSAYMDGKGSMTPDELQGFLGDFRTTLENDEWGRPNKNETYNEYMQKIMYMRGMPE